MSALFIPEIDDAVMQRLHERAARHARTAEAEAKAILSDALETPRSDIWSEVDAIRQRLAASGRQFSDSTELLREDRQR